MNQYNQTDHYILGIPTLNPEAAIIEEKVGTFIEAYQKG